MGVVGKQADRYLKRDAKQLTSLPADAYLELCAEYFIPCPEPFPGAGFKIRVWRRGPVYEAITSFGFKGDLADRYTLLTSGRSRDRALAELLSLLQDVFTVEDYDTIVENIEIYEANGHLLW